MKYSYVYLTVALLVSATLVMRGTMKNELRVAIDGPSEVFVGENFEYKIHIANQSEEATVLMYYMPPTQLEYVDSDSTQGDLFNVHYSQDMRTIYGQGTNFDVTVGLTMRACHSFEYEDDAPSYFIFYVCSQDGEETEVYKRQGLKIVEKL